MTKSLTLLACTLLLLTAAPLLPAQQTPPPPPATPVVAPIVAPIVAQSIDVTTTLEPMPLSANDRSVVLLEPRSQPLLLNSLDDILRDDSSLSLEARAGSGVQADISLRGTTFEQTLVLVNGLRINDPESGHLNLDIPIPFDAISR